VGEGICKSVIRGGRLIVKLTNSPYPLDVDPGAKIEVCTKGLVCT